MVFRGVALGLLVPKKYTERPAEEAHGCWRIAENHAREYIAANAL